MSGTKGGREGEEGKREGKREKGMENRGGKRIERRRQIGTCFSPGGVIGQGMGFIDYRVGG